MDTYRCDCCHSVTSEMDIHFADNGAYCDDCAMAHICPGCQRFERDIADNGYFVDLLGPCCIECREKYNG